ncbi:hypothetical protein OKT23_10800 [Providencia rettgeri]|uniref:hypothetical protein n=1 Tax=Providencia TaxID=586 RepID=UPI001E53CA19|nr:MULTISPECIES: hypothetical protein [Providencia]MCX9125238.1 hypothetical protein [Providencia rettgeri]MCX9129699.1 hypothetical protein [Providencia rettgeri]UEK58568.1 hypothetical protein LL668_14805 [Providencia rettgeri]HEM6845585.1 hypothetical protein [Providencia rettgeri]
MDLGNALTVNYEVYLKQTISSLNGKYNLRLEMFEANKIFLLEEMSAISKGIDSDNGTDKKIIDEYFYSVIEYFNKNKSSEFLNKYSEYVDNPKKRDSLEQELIFLAKEQMKSLEKPGFSGEIFASLRVETRSEIKRFMKLVDVVDQPSRDLIWDLGDVSEMIKASHANDYDYIAIHIGDYLERIGYIKEQMVEVRKNISAISEILNDKSLSNDNADFYHDWMDFQTERLEILSKDIAIINEVTKKAEPVIILNGNSGIPIIDLLGEWSISFIGEDYITLNSSKDVTAFSLNPPVLMPVVQAQ